MMYDGQRGTKGKERHNHTTRQWPQRLTPNTLQGTIPGQDSGIEPKGSRHYEVAEKEKLADQELGIDRPSRTAQPLVVLRSPGGGTLSRAKVKAKGKVREGQEFWDSLLWPLVVLFCLYFFFIFPIFPFIPYLVSFFISGCHDGDL